MTAISAAVFSGLLFFCLYVFGGEKSTSEGITTRYHGQLKFLYGSAIGLLGVALLFASWWFWFFVSTKNMPLNFRTAVLDFTRLFVNITFGFAGVFCLIGWILFYWGYCDWIRIDSDQVTSGFFVTTRSMRFDQIKEVNFTEVRIAYKEKRIAHKEKRIAHKEKNGSVGYYYSPTVEFELSSSEKVTWPGEPMIYVEQEFQQMLELKEIPYSTRRSRSYLSEKNESSNANQAGSISAATTAASIANQQSTADYVAQMRAKRELEEIVGSRWRFFSDYRFGKDESLGVYEEMIIEFRSDMTGTIQGKFDARTVVDTQMTYEVVTQQRGEFGRALHITLSADESEINARIHVFGDGDKAKIFSPSANGQLAEKTMRFFDWSNVFERQPVDPESAK